MQEDAGVFLINWMHFSDKEIHSVVCFLAWPLLAFGLVAHSRSKPHHHTAGSSRQLLFCVTSCIGRSFFLAVGAL